MDHRRADAGDSLVEILVAMAVLSIGITGLLTALATQVSTTAVNRDQAQMESVLTSAAEYVKSRQLTSSCSPAASPSSWSTIPTSAVPHGPAFVAEFSNTHQVGSISCSALTAVTVRVTGAGFQPRMVDVVTRP